MNEKIEMANEKKESKLRAFAVFNKHILNRSQSVFKRV